MAYFSNNDDDLTKATVGAITSERCIAEWGEKFFLGLVHFWNQNSDTKWLWPQDDGTVHFHDPHLVEVGWFLYQRACAQRNPQHRWQSDFAPNLEPPHLNCDTAQPVQLSDEMLIEIGDLARFSLARAGRERAMQQLAGSKITLAQAADLADKNGWAPIPARLAFSDCELPDQEWITLSETVGLLILGQAIEVGRTKDLRLTPDAEDLAIRALYKAAYQGHVHINGKLTGGASDSVRIQPARFREEIARVWFRDQIAFEGFEIWKDVLVNVETLKSWIERELKTVTKKALRPWATSRKAALEKRLQEFFGRHIAGLDRNERLPSEREDRAAAETALGERIPSHRFRPVRRKAYAKAEIELKSGRPRKKPAPADKKLACT